MATKIFVNLPVQDLKKSIDFFTKLGFSFNPQFTSVMPRKARRCSCVCLASAGAK